MFNRIFYVVLLATLFYTSSITVSGATAQSDEELERIDQAMDHLSGVVGQSVSRSTAEWSWSEAIFPDTSLGCPAQGQTYPQQSVRAYTVNILFGGTRYDYRVSADGSAVILCRNGNPDPSSIGITVIEAPTNTSTTDDFEIVESVQEPLGARAWWAWTYAVELDTLYLLNPNGERLSLPRPKLPNENINNDPKIAVSRDGRYLIVANTLNTGVAGIGFYDLQAGTFTQTHALRAGETVYLGFGYDNSTITGSPFIVDETNQFVAVGLANTDFSNPTWRVVVFELASGNALYQLEGRSALVTGLGQPFDQLGVVFPRVVYFGQDEVHLQLIPFGAGIDSTYPALRWEPNRNFAATSPFTSTNIDLDPITAAVAIAYIDPNLPAATEGLITVNNGIGVDDRTLYSEANAILSAPRWGAGGDVVLFRSRDGGGNFVWQVMSVEGGQPVALEPAVEAVYGTPQGYLTRTSTGLVQHVNAATTETNPVWQAPDGIRSVMVWASQPATELALDSVFVPLNITGVVNCPGTPESQVAIGFDAVSEVSLRVRDTPGGEYQFTLNVGIPFLIIGGPQCQGGYTWWQVRLNDGNTGWAAEGDNSLYFMAPTQAE